MSSRRAPSPTASRRHRHEEARSSRKEKPSVAAGRPTRRSGDAISRENRGRSRSPWRSHPPARGVPIVRRPLQPSSSGFRRTVGTRSPRRAVSPLRKKPAPINELDMVSMEVKKEDFAKPGDSLDDHGRSNSSYGIRLGSSFGAGGRGGYTRSFGSGRNFGRVPTALPALRRGALGRDFGDTRRTQGRNSSRLADRLEWREEKQHKEEAEKPVMNLFDPCKVPTGKSYFTHDDRTSKVIRPRGGAQYRSSFSNGSFPQKRINSGAPLGWRNARRDVGFGNGRREVSPRGEQRRSGPDGYSDGARRYDVRPSDGVWRHDLFEYDDDEDHGGSLERSESRH